MRQCACQYTTANNNNNNIIITTNVHVPTLYDPTVTCQVWNGSAFVMVRDVAQFVGDQQRWLPLDMTRLVVDSAFATANCQLPARKTPPTTAHLVPAFPGPSARLFPFSPAHPSHRQRSTKHLILFQSTFARGQPAAWGNPWRGCSGVAGVGWAAAGAVHRRPLQPDSRRGSAVRARHVESHHWPPPVPWGRPRSHEQRWSV